VWDPKYLFFSDVWEMGVSWHATAPPGDWACIYLRQQFAQVKPSHAFEVSSVVGNNEPVAITAPAEVYR